MRRYQANFVLGDKDHMTPTLEQAAELCIRWATSRNGAQARGLPLTEDVPTVSGHFGKVRTICVSGSDSRWWGLESRIPDKEDPDTLTWITELVLTQANLSAPSLTCTSSLISDDLVRPAFRSITRPAVVASLIDQYGGTKQFRLSTSALRLSDSKVKRFAEILLSPERTRPVIFASARNFDDKPCIDADALAFQLAGTAHVFVGEDRFPSLHLRNHLPQHLGCWDGAVRIYWPRMSAYDDPGDHPHWRAEDIQDIDATHSGGFAEYLLGVVSRVVVQTRDRDAYTISDLERLRNDQERMALRAIPATSVEDYRALLLVADEEIRELKRELEVAREDRDSAVVALRGAESKAQTFANALRQRQTGVGADREDLPVESVSRALTLAEAEFPDRLVFALNGKSDSASPYESPSEVATALRWLATTYHDAKTGTEPNADLELSLRSACGWKLKASQSSGTVGQYPEWYETKVDGKKYALLAHIGRGSSKDPREAIRIAFAWDDATKRVVVGYIGQHQETRKT